MPPARLADLFPHERGPADGGRTVGVAELREWPAVWAADPSLLTAVGGPALQAGFRDGPHRLSTFSPTDPSLPGVPLVPTDSPTAFPPRDALDPRLPPDAGIRDKVWQRLFVEGDGSLPQPGFAAVDGRRVRACNAPWSARIKAVDCGPARDALRAAVVQGNVAVAEGVGFAAVPADGRIRVIALNPHVRELLGGPVERSLTVGGWDRFVTELCARPLPLGVTMTAHNPSAEIGDALAHLPGSYILKPRRGSNGFGIVRVVSRTGGRLTAESDCPDTADYLAEFPADPARRGRDLVAAAAADRPRFADRARVGLSERALAESILEEEIRQDRADGSVLEPRVVVQRTGPGERFATLGAFCKRIDSPVGACVARDFREEPLDVSLRRFLTGRAPAGDLMARCRQTRDDVLAAGDRLRAALVPAAAARGARVHQFGIDGRLCWDAAAGRAEFWFIEVQFGVGRIDWPEVGEPPFAGYRTPAELRERFGPEVG